MEKTDPSCRHRSDAVQVKIRPGGLTTMTALFIMILPERKFIRYKEGAQLYGMSLSSFKELAKASGALYHPSEKIALINPKLLDEYLEYFRG